MSSSASREWMTSGKPVARAAAMWLRKPLLLRVARAVVVVIVEPGLADRHHLGMTRARDQLVGRDVELLVGMVRMRADRAEDVGKSLGDGEQLGVPLDPGRDRDDARRRPPLARARPWRRARPRNRENRGGSGCRPACVSVIVRTTTVPTADAQCRMSDPGTLAYSASNFAISLLRSSKTRWRTASSEPIRHLRDRLGQRRYDLVHIDGILLAAGRAVLRIELVDQVADQAMQTRPLFSSIPGLSNMAVLSIEERHSQQTSALYREQEVPAAPSASIMPARSLRFRRSAGTPAPAAAARAGRDPAAAAERLQLAFAGRDRQQVEQLAADVGMNGCARIATCRITSAVT